MNRTNSALSGLSRAETNQYPNAHLGHLSEAQEAALENFRVLCEEAGYYTPAGTDGRDSPSHDNATLLRYLRARKFSPKDALIQFKDTEDWRKKNHLDELYETIDIQEYEDTRKLYPQWTGRRDKRGIPIYLYKVSTLSSKAVSAYEKSISKSITVPHDEKQVPTKMLRLFALYENLMNHVLPLCTAMPDRPNTETPITQTTNIVDISNVSLRQFWNLKTHMQDASTLATAHYPETLDRIFIIGAPSFFPTVWGWIKRWFDPTTVGKIFILSQATMKPTLEQYMDLENIPAQYGGKLNFEFGQLPVLESAFQDHLKWHSFAEQEGSKTFPSGPIRWHAVETAEGGMQGLALGSLDRKPRKEVVAELSLDHPVKKARGPNLGLQRTHTTDGVATQPTEEGDLYFGSDLSPEGSGTPSDKGTPKRPSSPAPPTQTKAEAANDHETANDVATVPAAAPTAAAPETVPPITEGSSGKTGEQPRVGTSETRLRDQEGTLAHGKLEEGSPAVVDHGHGDRTVTMEPMTVGQAPKAKVVPELQKHTPTLLERAQGLAGAVYEQGVHAGQAVGLVKTDEQVQKEKEEAERKKKEEEEQHKRDVDDPKVNSASEGTMENFLRSGVGSEVSKAE